MATLELLREITAAPAKDERGVALGRARFPAWLLALLLLVLLYAAFAHGDVGLPTEARVQVALAALAATAGVAWLGAGSLRFAAPPRALVALALLFAFAVWSGATMLWSVAPDQTWLSFNRAVAYVIVLALGILAGSSHRRSLEVIAGGFFAIALAVTVYALGQKLLPGLHVAGLFNLDQTGSNPRLSAPLGYWNALALLLTFAVPIALNYAAERAHPPRARLAASLAVQLMVLTVGLTYSRGGVLALVVALVAVVALSPDRLQMSALLALACAATLPPLIFGLADHDLSATNVSLAHREAAGGELAALLLASSVLLWVAGKRLLRSEDRLQTGERVTRTLKRVCAGAVAVVLVGGVVALALSSRGFGGSIDHAWSSFTSARGTSITDPNRLLSVDSSNRWVWWKEALGAFSDRPIAGWGAGSFPVVHLLYRTEPLPVQQPHSVPLQFLAETGLVGAVLAIVAFGLLLAAAAGTVRRQRSDAGRRLAAALLAAGIAYAVHALYDWDWDIPAVTFPVLIFLGVLAGARRWQIGHPVSSPEAARRVHVERSLPGLGAASKTAALAGLAVVLCLVAGSSTLPSLARSKVSAALIAASSNSTSGVQSAVASAQLATRLDPASDDGLRVLATIALRRNELARARAYLIQAVRRVPSDVKAWTQLAQVELLLGDSTDLVRAARNALALNPRDASTRAVAAEAYAFVAPPNRSPTATGTPLPAR